MAVALGTLQDITQRVPSSISLGYLAGSFALWASVSEGKTTRVESSGDLVLLCFAAALGAGLFAAFSRPFEVGGRAGAELILLTGAFLVGYLKRFGILGAGVGSQIYIGELLAYGACLTINDLWAIAIAALISTLASLVPRVLSGPAERPLGTAALAAGAAPAPGWRSPEFFMGLQAASGALVMVALNGLIGLEESAWAITACTYLRRRRFGDRHYTARTSPYSRYADWRSDRPCLPVAEHAPLLVWAAAALAMVIYAMALPERYDIACAAFAFTLIVTLAASGEHSVTLLAARAWETLLGGALGLVAAMIIFPLRSSVPGE